MSVSCLSYIYLCFDKIFWQKLFQQVRFHLSSLCGTIQPVMGQLSYESFGHFASIIRQRETNGEFSFRSPFYVVQNPGNYEMVPPTFTLVCSTSIIQVKKIPLWYAQKPTKPSWFLRGKIKDTEVILIW